MLVILVAGAGVFGCVCNFAGKLIAMVLVANRLWWLLQILRSTSAMNQTRKWLCQPWICVDSTLEPMSRKPLQAFTILQKTVSKLWDVLDFLTYAQ